MDNTTNIAIRRRTIAARYEAHARDKRQHKCKTFPTMARLRLSEIERLFERRYGRKLPDDDAGRDDLLLALHHIVGGGIDVVSRCVGWARFWAPWMSRGETTALAEQIAAEPLMFKASTLGEMLGLTDAERTALNIRTIRPIDLSATELIERRKRLDRERKARQRQLKRAAKPAPVSHTKPWEAEGIDRATWYRRRAKPVSRKPATKSVRNNTESFTEDGNSRTFPPADAGPTPEGFLKGAKRSKKAWIGATQVAENWQPTESGRAYAQSKGMPPEEIAFEVEQFVNWHRMHGKSPWPNVAGAWKSWCDRYVQFENERRERFNERYERDRRFAQRAAR